MKDAKKVLEQFGMDPARVYAERKDQVQRAHVAVFEGIANIITHTMDFCKERGFGRSSKVKILQGASEAALYALAIELEHPSEASGGRHAVSFDSALFAGIFMALVAEEVVNKPCKDGNELEMAHAMFRKLRGRGFRDFFIETCGCSNCKARRKEHNIRFRADRVMEAGL